MTDYDIVIVALSVDDGGGFLGVVPDLPGCVSDGDTRDEATRNTEQAIYDWINENERLERPLAKPGAFKGRIVAQIEGLAHRVNELENALGAYRHVDDRITSLSRQIAEILEHVEHSATNDRFASFASIPNGDSSASSSPSH